MMTENVASRPLDRPGICFCPFLIVLAGLVAYANSMDGVFLLDDYSNFVNPRIETPTPTLAMVLFQPGRSLIRYSFAVNQSWNGHDVAGYHVVNLAIHLMTTLALYGVVRRLLLLQPPGSFWRDEAKGLALTTALLWVTHPLLTQGVTYIIQRAESMMALFYALTLYSLVRGAAGAGRGRYCWYATAILACALGMKTKEVMATAPLATLLLDRIYLAPSWRSLIQRRWTFYLALFGTLAFAMGSVRDAVTASGETATVGFALEEVTPLEYASSQPGVILHYLRLVVLPHPLVFDHGWPIARDLAGIAISAFLLAVLLSLVAWMLVRAPKLGYPAFLVFLILAPTSSVVPILDLAAEHRMYLPSAAAIAFCVLVARLGIARISILTEARRLQIARLLVIGVVTTFTLLTIRRNFDYASEITLWTSVVENVPHNARAHLYLGQAYANQSEDANAAIHFEQSIALKPTAAGRNNYAIVLAKQGRLSLAEEQLRESVRENPRYAIAWRNLSLVLRKMGNLPESEFCDQRAAALMGRQN